jgi:hypothetical protein
VIQCLPIGQRCRNLEIYFFSFINFLSIEHLKWQQVIESWEKAKTCLKVLVKYCLDVFIMNYVKKI